MANYKAEMTNCDPKVIAAELRKTANSFDPWPSVRTAAFWFMLGAIAVASMDYGDVWLCVGRCDAAPQQIN
jgi:hypothetical protein